MTKNKGMDHPAKPWAPTGTRALGAFLVLQEVTAPNFLKHLQPQIPNPATGTAQQSNPWGLRFLCTRKSTGSSGWTLRTKTNQWSLLKLLTLAEQDWDFQEEPKGLPGTDMLTLGPRSCRSSTSHVCTQVTTGQAHGYGWALTVKCQKQ